MGRIAKIERDAARDLTAFFEVSLDLLVIRDMHGRFVKAQPRLGDGARLRVEELIGRPMLAFIHPDDAAASRERMVVAPRPRRRRRLRQPLPPQGRSYRYLEWRARRMGELVFGVARDVTERLAIEAELRGGQGRRPRPPTGPRANSWPT